MRNFNWTNHSIHRLASRFGIYGKSARTEIINQSIYIGYVHDKQASIYLHSKFGMEIRVNPDSNNVMTVINLDGYHSGISFNEWIYTSRYDQSIDSLKNLQAVRQSCGLDLKVSVSDGGHSKRLFTY